jgi:cytoplasmic iron level regulating protein YaaA (DUF328/UPF0246 family)
MKIIISPSKKQNRKCVMTKDLVQPYFEEKSTELRKILENFDQSHLSKVLDIQGNLLEKTMNKYTEPNNSKAAICCYNGLVFKQLDINEYTQEAINYIQDKLCILSAMYGVLTPLTAIEPYRLDMKAKFEDINLYDYWQEEIDDFFKEEALIINLASNEFSKMLKYEEYKGTFINIDFKEYNKNNKLRIVAARAKKARGLLLNAMVKNQISNLEEMKAIEVLGYVYDSQASSEDHLVFIRE